MLLEWRYRRSTYCYYYYYFVGESVDDCGGGYSESIAEMCDELQNGSVALLMVTPNGRDESGSSRDCYVFNPTLHSAVNQTMFRFLGEDSRFVVIVLCMSFYSLLKFTLVYSVCTYLFI